MHPPKANEPASHSNPAENKGAHLQIHIDKPLFAHRFDLHVDCDLLANSRDRFCAAAEEQSELATIEWGGCNLPAGALRIRRGLRIAQQFCMQNNCLGDPVHGEVSRDVAGIFASPFHTAAFECDPGKLRDIEKLRATQMRVPLRDPGIDAGHVDLCYDRGLLRMIRIDIDGPGKTSELPGHGRKILVDLEPDGRMCRINLIGLGRERG